jgi:hypothetical protein
MSRPARLAIAAGFLIAAVIAFVIAKPGGDDSKTTTSAAATTPATATAGTTPVATTTTTTKPAPPPIPVVRVKDAKPVGGIKKLSFKVGDQIKFRVVSDTADEIHVHGYDLMKDVTAGGAVAFSFKGNIDGVFEVELENRGEQIAELEVKP